MLWAITDCFPFRQKAIIWE